MNEELIRQCAEDAAEGLMAAEDAIRLYHARAVAPLVEAIEYMIEHNGIECIPDTEAQNRISKALAPFHQEARQ